MHGAKEFEILVSVIEGQVAESDTRAGAQATELMRFAIQTETCKNRERPRIGGLKACFNATSEPEGFFAQT